jgi:uncharacterized protein YqeY
MSTKVQLEDALKDAMRASDDLRKRTLRMALSSIRLAEIDKGQPLDDFAVQTILQKEIKSRQEAIVEAQQARRPDLESASQDEIAVLEEYLPKQLSTQELEALAKDVVAEVGATSMKDMGQVMKVLLPRLQNRAPNDQSSRVVRALLGG